jgi:hypothetical protein
VPGLLQWVAKTETETGKELGKEHYEARGLGYLLDPSQYHAVVPAMANMKKKVAKKRAKRVDKKKAEAAEEPAAEQQPAGEEQTDEKAAEEPVDGESSTARNAKTCVVVEAVNVELKTEPTTFVV